MGSIFYKDCLNEKVAVTGINRSAVLNNHINFGFVNHQDSRIQAQLDKPLSTGRRKLSHVWRNCSHPFQGGFMVFLV